MRTASFDNPWRRLRWTAPASVVAWALILGIFIRLINEPVVHLQVPQAIDAELIEDESPPVPKAASEPKPVPLKQSQPLLPPRINVVPPAIEAPADPTPPTAAPAVETPVDSAPPIAVPPTVAPQQANSVAATNSNARAIYRPIPTIPDDLRDEAFSAAALARFDIAADGSITVVLVKPTQNPRLNRLLLESLRTWRFFPELKDGKPIASSQQIVVRFEVK